MLKKKKKKKWIAITDTIRMCYREGHGYFEGLPDLQSRNTTGF